MVTLQVCSDLHLEARQSIEDYGIFIRPSAEILALVGDISSPYDPKLTDFLAWCSKRFTKVFYVPGNHEYYTDQLHHTYSIIHAELDRICRGFSNVQLLHNAHCRIGDVLFIGSTLWSHVPDEHAAYIAARQTSFHYILSSPGQRVTVEQNNIEHKKCVRYIEQAVAYAQQHKLKPVVLTHYVPSFDSTHHPKHEGHPANHGYCTQLSSSHAPGLIRLWACGHTHHNFHHSREGYELISNQCGYGDPIQGYSRSLCITLEANPDDRPGPIVMSSETAAAGRIDPGSAPSPTPSTQKRSLWQWQSGETAAGEITAAAEEEAAAVKTAAAAPAAAPTTPATPVATVPACLFHVHARCNDALQKSLDGALQQGLGEVQGEAGVRQLFDEVYTVLFGTCTEHVKGMCYSLEDLRKRLVVEDEAPEAGILGRCTFAPACYLQSRSSLFCGGCAGPTAITIYLSEHKEHSRSRLGVAMTIAHELMHVYCHGQKHLARRLCVVLPGEEGLCELVAFYTGAFMDMDKAGRLQVVPQHNSLTRAMLHQEPAALVGQLSGRELHHYTQYRANFLQLYDEFRASETSLEEFINSTIQKGGIWSL